MISRQEVENLLENHAIQRDSSPSDHPRTVHDRGTISQIPAQFTYKPYLLFSPERLEEIRRLGREGPDEFQRIYQGLIAYGEQAVRENLGILEEEAQWQGFYVCDGIGDGNDDPNDGDGASLIFDPLLPDLYICPVDGRRYQGERYRQGWLGHYYYELIARVYFTGLAYALEPKPEYAAYVRQRMLELAERYLQFPLDDYKREDSLWSAHVMTETLGEANLLMHAMVAYDLVRFDPQFSEDEREQIADNFIRPAVEVIRKNPMGVTNWQAWHNAAIALAGFVLNDDELVHEALYGVNGHEFIRTEAIRDDGIWSEGSVGYHFYGMIPTNILLEALHTQGLPGFDERMKMAYASPFDIVQPDGSLPSLNDAAGGLLQRQKAHYEHANAHYEDSIFDAILTYIYQDIGEPRDNYATLFFGKSYEYQPHQLGSLVKEFMGIAILRSSSTQESLYALLDYGPQGLAHGHFDKLHFSLFGAGELWMPDLGTGSYSAPEHPGWFRNSIGHNTILIGEMPQQAADEEKRAPSSFLSELASFQIMQATMSSPVYPEGTEVRRTIGMIEDDYVVVVDDVITETMPIDSVFHFQGDWSLAEYFEPLHQTPWNVTSQNGYGFLYPPRMVNGEPASTLLGRRTAQQVRLISSKPYGFMDRFENVDDWEGNIGLSSDATEGRTSLVWTVVPRRSQTIQKTFHILNDAAQLPDTLVFDYKIGSDSFNNFILSIIGQPDYPFSEYEIVRGEQAVVDTWQTAVVDLSTHFRTLGTALKKNLIRFWLRGAEISGQPFTIQIDNLRAYRNGVQLEPEIRGINCLFPGGSETEYYLASGPSPTPPRVHPVLLTRRNDTQRTRHLALFEPFIEQENVFSTSVINESTLEVLSEYRDLICFDPEANQYCLYRVNLNEDRISIALLGVNEIPQTGQTDERRISYQAESPVTIGIEWKRENDDYQIHYTKTESLADELRIRHEHPVHAVLFDGQMISDNSTFFSVHPNAAEVVFQNLPAGEHVIQVWSSIATEVRDWGSHDALE
ncbi:MAG: heparinase II/III domain-containing protein [bacterium]